MTVREQVYQIISNTSGSVRAKDIVGKVRGNPAQIRQELTTLYREGKIQRRKARGSRVGTGRKPFVYYVDFSAPPVEPRNEGVTILVGDISMSATEARKLYDQLKLLFG